MTARHPAWTSMTGYAQLEFDLKGRHFKLQAKSVNHRYFEFRMRAPREWQMMENEIRTLCKEALQRGSVDFWIEEARSPAETRPQADANVSAAREFISGLTRTLRATQADWNGVWIPDAIKALILSRNSELWNSDETQTPQDLSPDSKEFAATIHELCEKLTEQRRTEGEQTRLSVLAHGSYIREQWNQICADLPRLKDSWRRGLEERIEKLSESLTGNSLDPQRIYQEFVLLADRRDVSEEVQRIDSHLKSLERLAEHPKESSVGKRLDFVCQELNREWTTLSNKIQDAGLNQLVGEAKLTIEKIREQSLNLV
jgi:uncharacterized protein (TIGR00255 family)